MLWGIIICLLLLSAMVYLIIASPFFQVNGLKQKHIVIIFSLKIVGGIGLYLLYTIHYSDRTNADIFKYFDDAEVIAEHPNYEISAAADILNPFSIESPKKRDILSNTQHWDRGEQLLPNDNRQMIRLNLLLWPISKGFYFFHLLFFSCLSFLGSMAIYHFFKENCSVPGDILFLCLTIPPSLLLWTSGLLKESFLFFALGFFLYSVQIVIKKPNLNRLPLLLFFLLLLLGIKSYLIVCILPSILIYLLLQKFKLKYSLAITFSFILLTGILLKDQLIYEVVRVQSNFTELALESNANSYFEMDRIQSLKDLVFQIPNSFYNVWILPLIPLEANLFSWISAAESWFYFSLFLLPIFSFNRDWKLQFKTLSFCILFVLSLSVLIGSTIPILGAIVRYRTPLIPFFLIALFTFVDWKKLSLFNSKPLSK